MGSISTSEARGLYTKMIVDVYKERNVPQSFLRSFFKVKESATKLISVEVQRGTEKIAVDVQRGTEGNRNAFGLSTERVILPPYYREYFDGTDLDLYDRLFGTSGEVDAAIFSQFMDTVAEKYGMLQDKIDRAYEKQCADVFTTGVLTLADGSTIDFKRKTASIIDVADINANRRWTDSTNSKPYTDLENGAKFLREKGKSSGSVVNAIMGAKALAAFLDNTKVQSRADIKNFSLDMISAPQRNSVGASYNGSVSAGAYRVDLWSYPEIYENASGVATPFIEEEKVILLPETPRFTMAFAAVPRLLNDGAQPMKGQYVLGDYIDERNSAHIFDIKSAGVAVPVAVDQIYTMKVVA